MKAKARFVVSGYVQGVCFRVSTRQQAAALGLDGIARNLADGSVEVIVYGDEAAISVLASWLQQGPSAARVKAVQRSAWDGLVDAGFSVG